MFKKISVLPRLFLVLFCVLLTGCGGRVPAAAASTPASLPSAEPEPEPFALRMINHPDGPSISDSTGNETGCYQVFYQAAGNNITYVDRATRQRVYLSSQLSSSHQDESDPSFLGRSSVYLFVLDSHLYCVQNGYPNADGSATPGKLLEMDLNGANRRVVTQLNATDTMNKGIIADDSDSGFIYTTVQRLKPTGQGYYDLCRISLRDGTQTSLLELQPSQLPVGAHGAEIYLQTVTDVLSGGVYRLEAYSLSTGQTRLIREWPSGLIQGFTKDQNFFYLDMSAQKLLCLDLSTGGEREVASGLDLSSDPTLSSVDGIYDNHFIYMSLVRETQPQLRLYETVYGVDLTDGTVTEIALRRRFMGADRPLKIIWEFPGEFLVISGEEPHTDQVVGPDGVPYTVENSILLYSLISKTDFWNNQPNYSEIENRL